MMIVQDITTLGVGGVGAHSDNSKEREGFTTAQMVVTTPQKIIN